ncbi:hypothetical protein DESUT3_16970 [Desulfuromonas versatilis]|uniref:Phosphatidic acid phosphatase type 2/haloperoxidase domain-containing protein n=1 Tax=Desulfuromonas versatilis TaxID=2802975 RepID=A0ABN6DWW6_9BACT|nr:bifunctional DedA family/phosphatase PAP2 family protein [Desulfuromonas versatilis]BCR04628.1 hypothetical protein DESUT3_16970 [Desulfuromonas versatilis]
MESWLQQFFDWLPSGGSYYLLIGVVAFLESLVGVGLLVPGGVLTVFCGFLAAHGKGDIQMVMAAAGAGAIVGDLGCYWAGARFGPRLSKLAPLAKRQSLIRRAELFFAAHGGKSVFLGRFFGPLRGVIPFVAGSAMMSPLAFFCYALISGVLWGFAYPGLGFAGGTSWQKVQQLTGRVSLLIAALVVLLVLNSLFWAKLAPRIGHTLARIWNRVRTGWHRLLRKPLVARFISRHPVLWSFLADRFSLHRGSGLYLTAGFLTSALFALLFVGLVFGLHLQQTLQSLDQWTYLAVQSLRHPATDVVFLTLTFLGSAPVVLMLGGLVMLWLLLNNRDFSAVILVAGTAGGELLVFLLKNLFQRPRPTPILPALEVISSSFPSAHAFVALVFYGLVVYMLIDTVHNWQNRFALVLAGSFLTLLIGFSRIYLGVHWLTDVLGGFALAAVWLTFLITASELRRRYAGEFPWRHGWSPLSFSPTHRAMILTAAALLVLGSVIAYLAWKILAIL